MKALGLNDQWIKLVISCISTITYSILINDKPSISFHLSTGLRQGDPLSHYLLFMCDEGLSCLINNAEQKGEIQGLDVARGETNISHILFADDNILFCKATIKEWFRVKTLLNIYENGLGQVVNN